MSQSMKRSDARLFEVISLILVLFSGCIKEDRGECPCRLVVGLDEVDQSRLPEVLVSVMTQDGFEYNEVRDSTSYMDDRIILVPRGEAFLNVYHGDEGKAGPEGLCIPVGEDCPAVYMYTAVVDTDCEYLRRPAVLKKNHCVLTVYVEGADEDFPFRMSLRGNVCGYTLYGAPLPGEFVCPMELHEDRQYVAAAPRQTDASLLLEVSDDQEVVRTFALGEYIRSCGYDWTEDDLKDIMIGIDYSRTLISVSVHGWDEVYEFDVVI